MTKRVVKKSKHQPSAAAGALLELGVKKGDDDGAVHDINEVDHDHLPGTTNENGALNVSSNAHTSTTSQEGPSAVNETGGEGGHGDGNGDEAYDDHNNVEAALMQYVGGQVDNDNENDNDTESESEKKQKVPSMVPGPFDTDLTPSFNDMMSGQHWDKFINEDIPSEHAWQQHMMPGVLGPGPSPNSSNNHQTVAGNVGLNNGRTAGSGGAGGVALSMNQDVHLANRGDQGRRSHTIASRRKRSSQHQTNVVDPQLAHMGEHQLVQQALLHANEIAAVAAHNGGSPHGGPSSMMLDANGRPMVSVSPQTSQPPQPSPPSGPPTTRGGRRPAKRERDTAGSHIAGMAHNESTSTDSAQHGNWHQVALVDTGGAFSKQEVAKLKEFMDHYQAANHMSRDELCLRVWSSERRKDNFWDSVAAVLPHRTRSSVYKHVRRAYHVFKVRGKWTPQEDNQLSQLVELKGAQWRQIGIMMGRMPEDCRDRWRNYVICGTQRQQNKWTVDEEGKLRHVVHQILEENPNTDINWTLVSQKMGGARSRIQCRYKWNKINKRASQRNQGHENNASEQHGAPGVAGSNVGNGRSKATQDIPVMSSGTVSPSPGNEQLVPHSHQDISQHAHHRQHAMHPHGSALSLDDQLSLLQVLAAFDSESEINWYTVAALEAKQQHTPQVLEATFLSLKSQFGEMDNRPYRELIQQLMNETRKQLNGPDGWAN